MNKITSIEIYPKMEKLKSQLPDYRDGGLTWTEYAYVGMLEYRNRCKFGRESELFELVKVLKEPD